MKRPRVSTCIRPLGVDFAHLNPMPMADTGLQGFLIRIEIGFIRLFEPDLRQTLFRRAATCEGKNCDYKQLSNDASVHWCNVRKRRGDFKPLLGLVKACGSDVSLCSFRGCFVRQCPIDLHPTTSLPSLLNNPASNNLCAPGHAASAPCASSSSRSSAAASAPGWQ